MFRFLGVIVVASCVPHAEPYIPRTPPAEPAPRFDRVVETKAIDDVTVSVVPSSLAWEVHISNSTENTISVLWDESTFVMSTGQSMGRLIRGETRRIDSGKTQPPSPIATHAVLVENVLFEGATEIIQYAALSSEKLVGGHLYITIETADGKKTWSGDVVDGRQPAGSP